MTRPVAMIRIRCCYALVWFCVVLATVATSPPSGAAEDVPADRNERAANLPRYTLIYGGDLFCARRLNFALLSLTDAERRAVLAEVAPLFREADLAMVNLEGMVTTGGYYNRMGNCSYAYRAFPTVLDMLKDAGIDLVTIANNHNGDYGPEAQVETVDHLAAAGIGYAGAGVDWDDAARPVYCRVGDVVVAIVSMETSDAKPYKAERNRPGVHFLHRACVNPQHDQEIVDHLAKIVREARRHAHLVFFSPHGANRSVDPYVIPPRRELAAKLIRESGFDAVLGHGAHHAEGVEIIDGKPVIHDAGNLVLDFDPIEKPYLDSQAGGMLWKVELSRAGVHRLEGIPLDLGFLRTHLAAGAKREAVLGHIAKYSREFGTPLSIDNGRMRVAVDPGPVIEPTEGAKKLDRPRGNATIRRAPTDILHEKLPEGAMPLDVRYENGIRLVGYEMLSPVLRRRGARMSQVVALYWTTDRPIRENYVVHLEARPLDGGHLRKGVVIREEPHLPGDWLFPTYMWPAGKIVEDTQNFRMDFRDRPMADAVAFYAGLRRYKGNRESTFLTPVEANGVKLFRGNLVPLGSRPIADRGEPPWKLYTKWQTTRKIELCPQQPHGAPPLVWPPEFGGD